MKRKILPLFLILVALSFSPIIVLAQIPTPGVSFGGLVTAVLPCTCPATAGNVMVFYSPFYLNSAVPIAGALVYVPYVTQLFAWYKATVPSTWHLGTFVPGTGNLACWIVNPALIGPPCIPMPFPAYGTISMVGTS